MIKQERIDEIALDAVKEQLRDLVHDRMGQGELLIDDVDEDAPQDALKEAMDRLEAVFRQHLPEEAGLSALLTAIEAADTDYPKRYPLVLRALSLAAQLGYPAGIGFDPKEGPEWPVVYMELPGVGQVSWHMPAHPKPFDGHTTAQKYERCGEYAARVESGAYDDEQ